MAIRTISAAYFVGEILVPNISGTTTTEQANLLPLQIAIAKYQPIYLKELLGEDLYDLYVAGIAEASPADKWTTLNNLIYYVDALLTAAGTGLSPVANYVYFFFMRSNRSLTMVNAEVQAVHENFTGYGPGDKMVAAWNEMVRMTEEIQDFIIENITDYPEYLTSTVAPVTFKRINPYLGC